MLPMLWGIPLGFSSGMSTYSLLLEDELTRGLLWALKSSCISDALKLWSVKAQEVFNQEFAGDF